MVIILLAIIGCRATDPAALVVYRNITCIYPSDPGNRSSYHPQWLHWLWASLCNAKLDEQRERVWNCESVTRWCNESYRRVTRSHWAKQIVAVHARLVLPCDWRTDARIVRANNEALSKRDHFACWLKLVRLFTTRSHRTRAGSFRALPSRTSHNKSRHFLLRNSRADRSNGHNRIQRVHLYPIFSLLKRCKLSAQLMTVRGHDGGHDKWIQ